MFSGRDIICIGSANWDGLWVNAQHMMWRLAERNRVLYVESPGLRAPALGSGADWRKVWRRVQGLLQPLRRPSPDRELHVLSPFVIPLHSVPEVRELNTDILAAAIRGQTEKLKFNNPLLWIFLPTAAGLAGRLGESGVIYYCVDDYRENPGVHRETITALENQLLGKADRVFATSLPLYKDLQTRHPRVTYTPNVADTALYARPAGAAPADLATLGKPVLGFVGNITGYKIDVALLTAIARARPDWQLALIGPVGEGDPATDIGPLRARANVHFLGRKPGEALPAYVQAFSLGIIPYRLTASTRSSFPMKFYEYLAAGLPIVSTPLESLAEYHDRPGFCRFAVGAEAWIAAIESALAETDPALRAARTAEAARHSWESRLELVCRVIEQDQPRMNTDEHG